LRKSHFSSAADILDENGTDRDSACPGGVGWHYCWTKWSGCASRRQALHTSTPHAEAGHSPIAHTARWSRSDGYINGCSMICGAPQVTYSQDHCRWLSECQVAGRLPTVWHFHYALEQSPVFPVRTSSIPLLFACNWL